MPASKVYVGGGDDLYVQLLIYHVQMTERVIENIDCTPYLLQLGLTKSRTSMVWIAGPLSGLIMQPIVGVIADNSRSKWGRRRPFMIGGSIIVALCLLILGWTAEIVGTFVKESERVIYYESPLVPLHLTQCRKLSGPWLWLYQVYMR